VTHLFRSLVGCAALAAGAWAVTAAAAETAPDLPAESYKKAADADLKFLQTRLGELVKKEADGKVPDGQVKPALGAALLLAVYAEALGDTALKAGALKVAEALDGKKFKDAEAAAKGLAVKPGKAVKAAALPKPLKDDKMLVAIMSPTRGASVGGLNIDRDIKDLGKAAGGAKLDPAAVEILGVRSAVINAYGFHSPNDKAKTNDGNKKLWEKYSSESVSLSKQIAIEAALGAKADEKKLRTNLGLLNRSCTECHNKFRDDE
jgi:cytochrome c556